MPRGKSLAGEVFGAGFEGFMLGELLRMEVAQISAKTEPKGIAGNTLVIEILTEGHDANALAQFEARVQALGEISLAIFNRRIWCGLSRC
jgi:hypothetical protein